MEMMTNEDKAQVALGLKFECQHCRKIFNTDTIDNSVWDYLASVLQLCRPCYEKFSENIKRYE